MDFLLSLLPSPAIPTSLEDVLRWAVLCACVSFVLRLLRALEVPFNACCRGALAPSLTRRHGDDAWAVVTGATDGLGLAYAHEFARRGLNVMLISRTKAKLVQRKAEIEAKYPDVSVDYLAGDFSDFDDKLYRKIEKALSAINVGILVNNCGVSYEHAEYLTDISDDLIERLIDINVKSLTYMTRIVLPAMYERGSGDIVNVTSVAGVWSPGEPLYAVYSGSKGYVNFFSRSLHHEAKTRGVHVQCHVPHLVATNMSLVKPSWPLVPTPAVFARAAVNHIGMGSKFMVTPYWFHDLFERLFDSLPLFLSVKISMGRVLNIRQRALRKKAILAFEGPFLKAHPEVADLDEKARRKAVRAAYEADKKKRK